MPTAEVPPNYRDVSPPPVKKPTGSDLLILSPILGAPNVVVSLGEYQYESRVSGCKQHLRLALISYPCLTRILLIDVISGCLEMSDRPTAVETRSPIFGQLTRTI